MAGLLAEGRAESGVEVLLGHSEGYETAESWCGERNDDEVRRERMDAMRDGEVGAWMVEMNENEKESGDEDERERQPWQANKHSRLCVTPPQDLQQRVYPTAVRR